MEMFVERASSDSEVDTLVRRKYGDRARILARKEVRSGGVLGMFRRTEVEVTGYYSHAPTMRSTRGTPSEERRKILESVGKASPEANDTAARPVVAVASGAPTSSTHGGSTPAGGGGPTQLDAVLGELRELKEHLGTRGGGRTSMRPAGLARLIEVLEENDFSATYRDQMEQRMRRELALDELDDFDRLARRAVAWIGETIAIYPWQERAGRPHVFVLVGPTGVGKTTTIAKLAAMYGAVADPPSDVRVLTIDSYRIGALQQIEKYCEIMGIPVSGVDTPAEMERQLALNNDADFVFVDTIGKSPFDFGKLAEVNQLVRSASGEVHLAISATTKRTDMVEILRQFEPFSYKSVVITKLDETSCVGGIISALHETHKSVSFFTDGQSVPQDISRAKRGAFLRRLKDLPRHMEEESDD